MKLRPSLLMNTAALWACHLHAQDNSGENFRRGFELCVISRDASEGPVAHAPDRSGQSMSIKLPAALSSSDLKRAKAITKSSWFVLSGRHLASTLLLKLKPSAAAGFRARLDRVISRGDQMAILLNGEVVGALVFNRPIMGEEIAIDASFFSEGTEKEKEFATRRMADQINSTLY